MDTSLSLVDILARIGLSLLLAGLFGLERKHYHKPAGIRTNLMVGLGATILALVGISIFNSFNPGDSVDLARMIGQIIAGIGFLGAGAIIQSRGEVHGMTTAATIWVVAAVGLSVGLGFYLISVFATVGAMLVLVVFGRLEHSRLEDNEPEGTNQNRDNSSAL